MVWDYGRSLNIIDGNNNMCIEFDKNEIQTLWFLQSQRSSVLSSSHISSNQNSI